MRTTLPTGAEPTCTWQISLPYTFSLTYTFHQQILLTCTSRQPTYYYHEYRYYNNITTTAIATAAAATPITTTMMFSSSSSSVSGLGGGVGNVNADSDKVSRPQADHIALGASTH